MKKRVDSVSAADGVLRLAVLIEKVELLQNEISDEDVVSVILGIACMDLKRAQKEMASRAFMKQQFGQEA